MSGMRSDPLNNVIQEGIKADIEFNLSHGRYRAAIILIFSGIDTMAHLAMPTGQDQATRSDFIRWADRYIKFPCKEQVTGEELYGFRCGMLHAYGPESSLSRQGKVRTIGFCDHCVPEIRFNPSIDSTLVGISLRGLKNAVFEGINRFLIEVFSNPARAAVVSKRLEEMVGSFKFTSGADPTPSDLQ